jgi:DmsE family decaheme c-type cytochrome
MKYLKMIAAAGVLVAAGVFAPASASDEATTVAQKALKQDAICTRCHDESEAKPVLSIYQTRHGVKADSRTPTCQDCHGDSDKHVKGDPNQKGRSKPDVVFGKGSGAYPPDEPAALAGVCLGCHKSGARSHWSGSQHQREDMSCVSCHQVHTPRDPVLTKQTQPEVCFTCHKEQRAQLHRISIHPVLEGKLACSNCHNPHGSTGPKLLVKNSVNETCFTCHDEKRGPFLWEHQPVSDDCTNCHTPHGSSNEPLLKARLPWLCQDCHSGDHARSVYSGANLPGGAVTTVNGNKPFQNQAPNAQIVGRDCLNCHSLIHGSNSPAGAKFQR